jgi:hypothetical protein
MTSTQHETQNEAQNDASTTTLEMLCNHLRKIAKSEKDRDYLEELIRRVETAYVKTLDVEVTPPVSSGLPYGWKPINDIQHVKPYSTVLLFFPYEGSREFDFATQVKPDIPLNFCSYETTGGYSVVATKTWNGKWEAGGDGRSFTDAVTLELDVSKATRFALFANSYSNMIRESIILSNRGLGQQVKMLQEILERKNMELDALGFVWCTGNCQGGQFFHAEPQEITVEMLDNVANVATRLLCRGANSGKLAEKHEWHLKWLGNYAKAKKKHDMYETIERLKAMMQNAKQNAAEAAQRDQKGE